MSAFVEKDYVSPPERRRNMDIAIFASVASVIGSTCGTGNILSLAAIKLGANEMFLGIFNFVTIAPYLLGLCTMNAIAVHGKSKVLYRWWWWSAVFALPLLLLPFAAGYWPGWVCLWLLAASTALRISASALGSTGWFPLLQDIVPRRYTGRFFARLRTTWQSANFIALIASAVILGARPGWWQFEIIFVFAVLGEVWKTLPVKKIVQPPPDPDPAIESMWSRVRDYCCDPVMRHYTVYLIFYYVASTALEPFKIKLLSDLGYGSGFILAATAMVGCGAVVTLGFWGRIADKFGNRAIFGISHIGMLVSTGLWLAVGKSSMLNMAFVLALYFFWSVFNSGNQIAQTNYMLRVVPTDKQNFLTLITLVQRLAAAFAPLVAGLCLSVMQGLNVPVVRGFNLTAYSVVFASCSVLFVVPHLMRGRLKAKTDLPTSHVINMIARPALDTAMIVTKPIKARLGRITSEKP